MNEIEKFLQEKVQSAKATFDALEVQKKELEQKEMLNPQEQKELQRIAKDMMEVFEWELVFTQKLEELEARALSC